MKNKIKLIISELIIVFTAFIIILEKDTIIIYSGIKFYKGAKTISITMGCIIMIVLIIQSVIKNKKAPPQKDNKETYHPPLSYKENLNSDILIIALRKAETTKWKSLRYDIDVSISHLNQMNEYQEKLHTLLEENDVKALSDTENMLKQAEQYMCQNIRKAINYMNIYDPADMEPVKKSLRDINRKNEEQLNQAKDFVIAIADFANNQGTAGQISDLLDTYKKVIIQTVVSSEL